MQIGIDANEANIVSRVGVGQYAFNIIWELYRQDTVNTYHLYLKQSPLSDLPPQRPNWTYHIFGPGKMWTKLALPFRLYTQKTKLDLFFSPSHYSPHFSPFATIPTIHDLGYLQSLNQFNKKDIYQLTNWTRHSIKQAHHIVAVSQFTKNEINRIYQVPLDKITVAPNGVEQVPTYTSKETKAVLTKFKINQPYLLTVGTLKPNKNIPFLLSAFAKTKHKLLVIAGKKGWLFDDIFAKVELLQLEDRVIFTDYITQDEKWILLKNALVSVLTSTYEGFGIPAIESLKVGTPIIASDIPAYQEILGDSVRLIDPTKESELVASLQHLPKFKSTSIVDKYTWANSARILIQTFNKV